jgi:hypothetical protein
VELRSADNEVLSVDYGEQPPTLSRGRPVALDELQFTGLKQDNERPTEVRQFSCPHCGAPVQVQFADSKAITCGACHALIDLSRGVGGELVQAQQDEFVAPKIPLGSTGLLQGVQWQVVGYQHRVGNEPGDTEEQFEWDEYLLYNRKRGFSFLVDSDEGWTMVKPASGAPSTTRDLQSATYLGTTYRQQSAYKAQTAYVAGEFYWPVERGQVTFNRDYARGTSVLSLEENPRERTWSVGSTIDSDTVAKAFGLKDLLQRGDAGPIAPRGSGMGCGCGTLIVILLVILLLVAILKAIDDDRSGGGRSYGSRSGGGWSSGGAHK